MQGKKIALIVTLISLGLLFIGSIVGSYIFYSKYVECENRETIVDNCKSEEDSNNDATGSSEIPDLSTEESTDTLPIMKKVYVFNEALPMKDILADFQRANENYTPFPLYYFPNAEVVNANYDVSENGGGVTFALIVDDEDIGLSQNTYGIGGSCEGECTSYFFNNDTLGLQIDVQMSNGDCIVSFVSEANYILTFQDDSICEDKIALQELVSKLKLL